MVQAHGLEPCFARYVGSSPTPPTGLFPPFAVECFVDFAELLVGDMGVDLRGGDIRVAEEFLHGADIGSVHQEIGGELMPELMRVDARDYAGFFRGR